MWKRCKLLFSKYEARSHIKLSHTANSTRHLENIPVAEPLAPAPVNSGDVDLDPAPIRGPPMEKSLPLQTSKAG